MLFAGFKVSDGDLTLFGVIAAGVAGNLIGSWIAYAIGYYGRIELLERQQADPHRPKRYSTGRTTGSSATATRPSSSAGCCRSSATFISLPAGVAEMPLWRFIPLTLAGSIPWVSSLALIGRAVGEQLGQVEGPARTSSTTWSSLAAIAAIV